MPPTWTRLDRNQMRHVQLVRDLEQHAVMVFRVPAGESAAQAAYCAATAQLRGMLRFIFQPARDVLDETCLGQRLVEQRFQLRGDG